MGLFGVLFTAHTVIFPQIFKNGLFSHLGHFFEMFAACCSTRRRKPHSKSIERKSAATDPSGQGETTQKIMWTRIVKLADHDDEVAKYWQQEQHWELMMTDAEPRKQQLLPMFPLDISSSSSSSTSNHNDVFDNTSEHYYCSFFTNNECGPCPNDHHMVWKVLQWTKIVALKVARSYYAFPVFLVIAPLLIGMLIGFALGRRRSDGKRADSDNKTHPAAASFWTTFPRMILPSTVLTSVLSVIPLPYKLMLPQSSTAAATVEDETSTTPTEASLSSSSSSSSPLVERENRARQDLLSRHETERESGIPIHQIPQHVAVIMDGNRRYGRETYDDETRGHWEGSRKLLDLTKWCQAEGIEILTVYAFSTENWKRDPAEVAALMSIFVRYCEELRQEALERNLRVCVLSTDTAPIPDHVQQGLQRLQEDTRCCTGLQVNVCLSYGSRGEIVGACRDIATECVQGKLQVEEITENLFCKHLLTQDLPDPDILIRTSGEVRISNFLLWQVAYSELFFLDKKWPEMEKQDLIRILRTYAKGRQRRFGR